MRNELHYQNRINLMQGRNRENQNIIKKCKRKLKQLGGKNDTGVMPSNM